MTPENAPSIISAAGGSQAAGSAPVAGQALSRAGLRLRSLPFARPDLTQTEMDAVQRVMSSGWLTSGPETKAFEDEFAAAVGAKHAVALNSATAGLHLALELSNPGPEHAVLVPTITFTATAEVVAYNGAMPLILDVDRSDYLLTPEIVERFLARDCSRTADGRWRHRSSGRIILGMMPVHYGGRPCELTALLEIARSGKMTLIEDAAHAFPTRYKGRPIGAIGPLTVFSFYATKNLTTGEGGMLTTDNAEWAERLRRMRLHGIRGQTYGRNRWHYDVVDRGYKYNMTDMGAAMGRVQLQRSGDMLTKRKAIHELYDRELAGLPGLRLCPATPHESAHHLYTLEIGPEAPVTRDRFVDELRARGIGTSLHFIPLHRHSYYREQYGLENQSFANAEEIFARIVSLPIYSAMSLQDAADVVAAIRSLYTVGFGDEANDER